MNVTRNLLLAAPLAILAACGGSSSSPTPTPTPTSGNLSLLLSDASTEDWATIGVKVLGISLVPQGGGTAVSIYTAPTPPPVVNLVQLDQLGEILGNVQVPPGTYVDAVLSVSANPGDVVLTAAADPSSGFAGTAGTTVPPAQIQIQGAKGAAGSLTVPVTVKLVTPLAVTAGQSNALNLEFDLSHPAFIVEHVSATGTTWAVNFKGPVRHRGGDIAKLVLRHLYATVTGVSTDNSTLIVTKDFPVTPATTPETAIASQQSLELLADSANGTIFHDLDGKKTTTVKDFASVAASLTGKYIRAAARYQQNGTLVAVRIWASSSFNSVWLSPEGHVLHVDGAANVLTVANEDGKAVPLTVDANTKFYFRVPDKALADATPIGQGTSFLANVKRGFKVHVSVVDPLATPLVAQDVDIEIARFDGKITTVTSTGFDYNRTFATVPDSYASFPLAYISATTPNGKDPVTGTAIQGFKWWDLGYPTLLDDGANAVADFVAATGGSVTFGGTAKPVPVWGASYAVWNDPAAANAWSALWTVLVPTEAPLGKVATAWTATADGGSFGMTVPGGTNTVTVKLKATSGSAALVYQVDRTSGVVTVSPEDLTSQAGLAATAAALGAVNTPVKVFAVPNVDGTLQDNVLFYYTGTLSTK